MKESLTPEADRPYCWFVKDWRCSLRVARLSLAEQGMYRTLIDECWLRGNIPDDFNTISTLFDSDRDDLLSAWKNVRPLFEKDGDRLVSPRLEAERARQRKIRERKLETTTLNPLGPQKVFSQKSFPQKTTTTTTTTVVTAITIPATREQAEQVFEAYPKRPDPVDGKRQGVAWITENVDQADLEDLLGAAETYCDAKEGEARSKGRTWREHSVYVMRFPRWLAEGHWREYVPEKVVRAPEPVFATTDERIHHLRYQRGVTIERPPWERDPGEPEFEKQRIWGMWPEERRRAWLAKYLGEES